ncbi:hypothetical protein BDY24DRAFT_370822 [Mrakia frigida]|uniref:uncharacterized protein n=1 Tax=Mrakia frigida TaxID=29902 RepID=UPI003FCC0A2A
MLASPSSIILFAVLILASISTTFAAPLSGRHVPLPFSHSSSYGAPEPTAVASTTTYTSVPSVSSPAAATREVRSRAADRWLWVEDAVVSSEPTNFVRAVAKRKMVVLLYSCFVLVHPSLCFCFAFQLCFPLIGPAVVSLPSSVSPTHEHSSRSSLLRFFALFLLASLYSLASSRFSLLYCSPRFVSSLSSFSSPILCFRFPFTFTTIPLSIESPSLITVTSCP